MCARQTPCQFRVTFAVSCARVNDSQHENLRNCSELEMIVNYVRGLLCHNLVPNLKRMLIFTSLSRSCAL